MEISEKFDCKLINYLFCNTRTEELVAIAQICNLPSNRVISNSGFVFHSDIEIEYGTTKAAVVHLTKYVATQYGKQNIRCNGVAPGLMLTPAAKNNLSPALLDTFMKYNALPYHGEPEDIANTVLFLASDEAKFITGQTIQVEGGHYLANPTVPDFVAMSKNL